MSCPTTDSVKAGSPCNLPIGTQCKATFLYCGAMMLGSCACEKSVWVCPQLPACGMDASAPPTCPDPTIVIDGTKCPSPGLQCKGNPTSCAGDMYYDALECGASGLWTTLAATQCGIDSGVSDAIFDG